MFMITTFLEGCVYRQLGLKLLVLLVMVGGAIQFKKAIIISYSYNQTVDQVDLLCPEWSQP